MHPAELVVARGLGWRVSRRVADHAQPLHTRSGPLVNTAGQVIGVITAGPDRARSPPGGGEGLAIPINDAIAISGQIEAGISSPGIHLGPT